MRFLTSIKLGPKRSLTTEGYLLCTGVPLARTGEMLYGPGETPVRTGPNGFVKIKRTADELFKAETIDSFAGKPMIKMHPRTADGQLEFVSPKTWKGLTLGIIMNPRRGTGADDDVLLGDLLITDEQTINEVRNGHPDVSAGYDSDYFEIEPGLGEQRNILANHLALVPSGRCGPRCSIGDHAHQQQENVTMSKPTIWQRIREAFTSSNAQEFDAAMTEAEASVGLSHAQVADEARRTVDCAMEAHQQAFNEHAERNDSEHAEFHSRLKALEGKVATVDAASVAATADAQAAIALEQRLEAEAPASAKGRAGKAADSRYLGESFAQVVSGAEILMPGLHVPTFDEAAKPQDTLEAIDGLRRKTLDAAYQVPDTRAVIDNALGGKEFNAKTITADEARTLFNATVTLRRASNNANATADRSVLKPAAGKTVRAPSDINRINADHYGVH